MDAINAPFLGFVAILLVLTLFALYVWYSRRGAAVEDAERRVFNRFVLGLVIFWLFAAAAYFGAPLLSASR
jgi:hypothetical protein